MQIDPQKHVTCDGRLSSMCVTAQSCVMHSYLITALPREESDSFAAVRGRHSDSILSQKRRSSHSFTGRARVEMERESDKHTHDCSGDKNIKRCVQLCGGIKIHWYLLIFYPVWMDPKIQLQAFHNVTVFICFHFQRSSWNLIMWPECS